MGFCSWPLLCQLPYQKAVFCCTSDYLSVPARMIYQVCMYLKKLERHVSYDRKFLRRAYTHAVVTARLTLSMTQSVEYLRVCSVRRWSFFLASAISASAKTPSETPTSVPDESLPLPSPQVAEGRSRLLSIMTTALL